MSKYQYRLWFPMVNFHGACFDEFCEKCQDKIEEEINDGYVLPTTIQIDTMLGITIKFGWTFLKNFEPCKNCQQKLKEFFDSADFLSFSNKPIELWRNRKEA